MSKQTVVGERREIVFTHIATNSLLEQRGIKVKKIVHPSRRIIKVYIDLGYETAVGIARCHPNDKWDMETGERIALTRALAKIVGLPTRLRWD